VIIYDDEQQLRKDYETLCKMFEILQNPVYEQENKHDTTTIRFKTKEWKFIKRTTGA